MALVLASPLQRYLQGRSDLNQVIAAAARHHSAGGGAAPAAGAQWNDPAFVERQARARLQFARPGDRVFVVLMPGMSKHGRLARAGPSCHPGPGQDELAVEGLDDASGRRLAAVSPSAPLTESDRTAVTGQLGRTPRAMRAVAHRCPCGLPDVIETSPRLPDGTPFPTLYYLTCPRATAQVATLEATGLMRMYADRLSADPDFAASYRRAHARYLELARRAGRGARDRGV